MANKIKMLIVNIEYLERDVVYFCSSLVNRHKKQRRYIYKGNKYIWDLPCVAVSCSCNGKIFHDYSKPVRRDTYKKVRILEDALLKLGNIGEHIKGAYPVGHCAEPHAAKKCMLDEPKAMPSNIIFSSARIIRTKEIIDYCGNCKNTFDYCNGI